MFGGAPRLPFVCGAVTSGNTQLLLLFLHPQIVSPAEGITQMALGVLPASLGPVGQVFGVSNGGSR